MKTVLILNKDHTVSHVPENKLTKSQMKLAKYVGFQVDENNTYVFIKPSKYLIFQRAKIAYCLCATFKWESDPYIDYVSMSPVEIETESVTDVITCMNSIERLSLVNKVLNPYISDRYQGIGLTFFHITLFDKNDSVIYDNGYYLKGVMSNGFDPYKALSMFDKLYTMNVSGDLYTSTTSSICIYEEDKNIYWDLRSIEIDTSCLYGINMVTTNTIHFCDGQKYISLLNNVTNIDFGYMIYDGNPEYIHEVSEHIKCGLFDQVSDFIDGNCDLIMDEQYTITHFIMLLECVIHLKFIIQSIYILYKYDNSGVDDIDILIKLRMQIHKNSYEIMMNIETLLSSYRIIELIFGRTGDD